MNPIEESVHRPTNGGRLQLSRKTSAACVLLTTGVMLAVAWWMGLREPDSITSSPDDDVARRLGTDVSPPGGTLAIAIGDNLPRWQAEGWLSGDPPTAPRLAGKVIVADVWNDL